MEPNALPFCATVQEVTTHICMAVWVSSIIYPPGTGENAQAEGLRVWPGLPSRSAAASGPGPQMPTLRLLPSIFRGYLALLHTRHSLGYVSAQLSVLTEPPNLKPLRFTGWNPTSSQNLRSVKSHQQNRILSLWPLPCVGHFINFKEHSHVSYHWISITILGQDSNASQGSER